MHSLRLSTFVLACAALVLAGCDTRQPILSANAGTESDGLGSSRLKSGEPRGKLLYGTHCKACHTAEIHWREQNLATDWNSLVAQVRRWQASIGLGWSDEEIADVASYLNALHYGFPEPEYKGDSQINHSRQVMRRY